MEQLKEEKSWNKKRIFLFLIILFLLIALGFGLKTFILVPSTSTLQSVRGKKTEKQATNSFSLPNVSTVQKALQQKLEDVKEEIIHLNVENIASSSPQIQKVINDLNALRQYPANQVKDACLKICSGL